jgi:hypothetical protein
LVTTTFIRKVRKGKGTYLVEVESYREGGKVRQRFIRYIGKEIGGPTASVASRRMMTHDLRVIDVRRSLDVEIVDRVSRSLGINGLVPASTMVLVYSQLLDRPSINRMEEYLGETEILSFLKIDSIGAADLYNSLSELNDDGVDFSSIERHLSSFFVRNEGGKHSVIVDVTDTYFTGDSLEGKRRRGKEGRTKKLIQIALAVSERHGFPLFHRTYPGNLSNKRIFGDVVKDLWLSGYRCTVIDRGMTSEKNLDDLLSLKVKVICGLRRSAKLEGYIDRLDREEIYSKAHLVQLKNTKVYAASFPYRSGSLIVVYNPTLEAVRRDHYYEHSSNEEVARYLGYSLIYHDTGLSEREVVRAYFEKDIVERAFKQLKGVLDLRPVRVWLKSHIEAHVKVCYLAYAILSLLNYKVRKLGITGAEALDLLRTGYRVYLTDEKSGFKWDSLVTLKKIQEDIVNVVTKNG